MADLCSQLHSGTSAAHHRSDTLINLKLVIVATDKELWAKTMVNFYFIFKALEEQLLRNKDHKYIWFLYIPELLRTKSFEEDMKYYYGDNWSAVVCPSTATRAFINRLREVGKDDPLLLVAYCHSFYLGLMAGGQIIIKTITRSLGLNDGQGTAAFQFREKTALQLKKQLKDSINGLDIDDELKQKIICEKVHAYEMTNAIVKEIDLKPSSFTGFIKLLFFFVVLPLMLAFLIFHYLGTFV